ncbi:cytochrome [Nocardioides sp. Root1257]|uniref:cytochrome P450 n=1 Tax=unclassified Nocardioides TaxID=2615069 RepID=UPI0006FDDED0|nr:MULTISPECIES: cytochrome P450 [unclassified Nocardioides]KQW45031.1 cytochrome [Nocardioides sp. Root1257]KRC45965.1 cytochrome [Nocardioides sp. Root224]
MTAEKFGRDMFDDFDIDAPVFNDRFLEIQDELVSKCPVAHSTVGDGYHVINRYEDVKKAGQDWKTFSSAKGFQPNRADGVPYLYPEECDPPYHNNWRTALNPFFAPGPVSEMEDAIRQDARELIDAFADQGSCEFVSEFAAELPGRAFFKNLIGVPVEDLPMLLQAMDAGIYGPVEERPAAFGKAFGYLGEYLATRKDEPNRGDLIDTIAAGVERDGEPCPWEDRVSILTDLTLGGIATTTYVMSGAIYHLATHPEDRKKLVADPSMIPNAIEEFVRFFPPVVALGRSVTQDVELGGYQFKKDDFVLLNYASASRDPEAVDDPQTLDIERDRIVHTAFGVGVHRCIGSHLARLELRVVLEEFLARIPEFEVKPGMEPSYETGVLRTMKSLELVF